MGMSNYIMDVEENFWGIVAEFIKEAEHVGDVMERAEQLAKNMAPFMDADAVSDGVGEMWNEYWSEYASG